MKSDLQNLYSLHGWRLMKFILILLGILLLWSFQCILFIKLSHFNGLLGSKVSLLVDYLTFPMSSRELYYLSILVTKVKGLKSYEDIRTVNGITYPSFRDACYALGLLDDDIH